MDIKTTKRLKKSAIATAIVCSIYGPGSVLAQDSTNNNDDGKKELKLERIEVTSQRRVESVQDVPISVAALGVEQLESYSIEKVEDL